MPGVERNLHELLATHVVHHSYVKEEGNNHDCSDVIMADWCPSHADNVDLGTACGKLHRVCVLAITDPGEHGLLHCWLCLSVLCLDIGS